MSPYIEWLDRKGRRDVTRVICRDKEVGGGLCDEACDIRAARFLFRGLHGAGVWVLLWQGCWGIELGFGGNIIRGS